MNYINSAGSFPLCRYVALGRSRVIHVCESKVYILPKTSPPTDVHRALYI